MQKGFALALAHLDPWLAWGGCAYEPKVGVATEKDNVKGGEMLQGSEADYLLHPNVQWMQG